MCEPNSCAPGSSVPVLSGASRLEEGLRSRDMSGDAVAGYQVRYRTLAMGRLSCARDVEQRWVRKLVKSGGARDS